MNADRGTWGPGVINPAQPLYFALVAQARQPEFYRDFGVPDTIDGRYDMIVLHAALIFRRLRGAADAGTLSDDLFEVMFADLDRSLREMGLGDVGVGKRVRQMARGFYGRATAYDRALDGEDSLDEALRRNVYGTVQPEPGDVASLAAYVRAADAVLKVRTVADLVAAEPGLPSPAAPR